jgi:hypothetical protein
MGGGRRSEAVQRNTLCVNAFDLGTADLDSIQRAAGKFRALTLKENARETRATLRALVGGEAGLCKPMVCKSWFCCALSSTTLPVA